MTFSTLAHPIVTGIIVVVAFLILKHALTGRW